MISAKITRQQTAREEIDLALHLLFTSGSMISANLLGWAAIDVMAGVAKSRGVSLMADELVKIIQPGRITDWFRLMKEHYNFAKHADKDPDKVVELTADVVEFVAFEGLVNYQTLYRVSTLPMMLHSTYMFAKHPDIVKITGKEFADSGKKLLGDSPTLKDVSRFYAAYLENKSEFLRSVGDSMPPQLEL